MARPILAKRPSMVRPEELARLLSLAGSRSLAPDLEPPPDPDAVRNAKGWLQSYRTDGRAYTPTLDQPALTEAMDLDAARAGSRSFDTLWRQVERLVALDG